MDEKEGFMSNVWWLLVPIAVVTFACPTPTQYGGPIAVSEGGLAPRLRQLCRAGLASRSDPVCAPPAPTAQR
jgi:hypothetical protein